MAENDNGTQNGQYTGNVVSDMSQGNRNSNPSDFTDQLRNAVSQGVRDGIKGVNPKNASQSFFNDRKNQMQFERRRRGSRRGGTVLDQIEAGIEEELLNALAGGDFEKKVKKALDTFANDLGTNLEDLPHDLGSEIGKKLFKDIRNSKAGQEIEDALASGANKLLNHIFDGKGKDASAAKDAILKMGQSLFGKEGGAGQVADLAKQAGKSVSEGGAEVGKVLTEVGAGAGETGSALAGLADVAISAGPYLLLIVAALEILSPALEGLADIAKASGKAFTREEQMRKKRLESAQARIKADMEYLAKEPFEILTNAANKWADTWDANLSKISLTQGYTKEDVYDLYSSMSERLIAEGLGSVIPATDVISKLNTILDSGLSGKIAEEFAYEAVKLSAAIPTEDFTGYAATYAQLASEAQARGASQGEAIAYANQQLEEFASNLLYSSRNLAGGFTTGLKNAQELFTNAVEIAQTAKTSNASAISGTLTSVSAIIGAVAPDLASGLVNNIVNAAIGGNSDTIVALRSLAGINAGNTEFLQALANNPQQIFVDIFKNLANMQNMSPDNYMEVAEGLSSVFGVDMKALARVDFNNLANQIAAMDVNSGTLEENLSLLASGEATMSTEQLKVQEINNAILEEGLAYIIDSEAGRMIQQHMWEEQIANELENATYAVDLQGSALSFLEGIRETITNIMNFLNPIGFINDGVRQLVATAQESLAYSDDVREILELTAVGSNSTSLTNLTTTGQDLGLTRPLVEMLGGSVGSNSVLNTVLNGIQTWTGLASRAVRDTRNFSYDDISTILLNSTALGAIYTGLSRQDTTDAQFATSLLTSGIQSKYSGFNVGKNQYNNLASSTSKANLGSVVRNITSSATQNAIEQSTQQVQNFLDSAAEASKSMSYETWLATARDYGIADYEEALTNAGLTTEQVRGYFEASQAGQGALAEVARKEDEQKFRDENRGYWDYESGQSGVFWTAIWSPFLNENFKPFFDNGGRYDRRMDAVDLALSQANSYLTEIDEKLGNANEFTVISVLTSINTNIQNTFVSTNSAFQKCLADWLAYIKSKQVYTTEVSNAQAWSDLQRAEGDQKEETLLALANALNSFSAEELQKLDPQLQTNALLGKIVIILEAMMQQNNNAGGGLSLIDTMSALGLGVTANSKL